MTKSISDMYLAAAMLAYGATLEGIDRSDKKRQKFVFSETVDQIHVLQADGMVKTLSTPTLLEIESHFLARSLLFPPNYPDSIRSIKSAIYANEPKW